MKMAALSPGQDSTRQAVGLSQSKFDEESLKYWKPKRTHSNLCAGEADEIDLNLVNKVWINLKLISCLQIKWTKEKCKTNPDAEELVELVRNAGERLE